MLKTGTLTLYDENDNDLNIDMSVTQILTIVRILGIRQNNNNDISSISCFGDLGLAEINEKILNKYPDLFGTTKRSPWQKKKRGITKYEYGKF